MGLGELQQMVVKCSSFLGEEKMDTSQVSAGSCKFKCNILSRHS